MYTHLPLKNKNTKFWTVWGNQNVSNIEKYKTEFIFPVFFLFIKSVE